MKKVVLWVLLVLPICCIGLFNQTTVFADSKNDVKITEENGQITMEVTEYRGEYYLNGELVYQHNFKEDDYIKAVKNEKSYKEAVKAEKKQSVIDGTSEDDDLVLRTLLVDEFGVLHDPIIDDMCTTAEYICGGVAIFDDVSYSTFYTTVKLFPKRDTRIDYDNNPLTPTSSGYIQSKMVWDVPPTQRHNDFISISWDSDDFSIITSSLYAKIENDITVEVPKYFLYFILIGYDEADYQQDYTLTPGTEYQTFSCNDYHDLFNITENGVVFEAPLMDNIPWDVDGYLGIDPTNWDDPYPFPFVTGTARYVNEIVISLYADLILDHGYTINTSGLTNGQFAGDYLHYEEHLCLDLGLSASAGLSISGPSAGISISPTIELSYDYDYHRRTFIQVFFNITPSC